MSEAATYPWFSEPPRDGAQLDEIVAQFLYEADPLEDSAEDMDGRTLHHGVIPWRQLVEYGDVGQRVMVEALESAILLIAKLRAVGIRVLLPGTVAMPADAREAGAMTLVGEAFLRDSRLRDDQPIYPPSETPPVGET